MTAPLTRQFRALRSLWTARSFRLPALFAAAVIVAAGCGGGGGTTPDFSLTLAQSAVSIAAGANTTIGVTIARTGLTDAVSLTLTGAPAGVVGSFNPASPIGNSSTLTLSVGSGVAPGPYTLTVTGTAGTVTHSKALTLTVPSAPDYALSLAPAALSIVAGGNGTSAVSIVRTNFTGAVALSLGGGPAGVTGAFAPAAPTGLTSTLTVTVEGSVTPGVYNLTVDGAATAGAHSTPLVLTVTAPTADYSLSLSSAAFTVAPGAAGTATVTLARTNFTGAVTLSLGGAPAGITGAFAPAAPTGTTSTLTVTVGAAVTAGTYNLTVDGTGTAGARSTPLALTVSVAPDYSLALAPASLPIMAGTAGTSAVTLTRSNFTGAVTLSLGGAPNGVTGAFAPAAPTGTTSTLTVTVGAAVAPGVYNLTVDGTGTAGARSTPLTLTVVAVPDYALSIAPDTVAVTQGATGTGAVTITRTNFTGAVTLSLTGAPAGVTGDFAPNGTTGTTSTLTVTVSAAVAAGAYPVTLSGTGAPGARTAPVVIKVVAALAYYALSLNFDTVSVVQSATGTRTVTIARTNFTGAVTLSLGGAPAGVTGVFAPPAPTGTTSTLTLTVGAAVAAGTYNLTVGGTGTPGAKSTPLALTVVAAAANYTLSATAASIAKGASGPSTVTIARTNFTGAVTLSLTGAPAGVTGTFNPAAPTGTSSTLTLTVGASVAAGTYSLTVNGTGTAGARTAPLSLTVTGGTGGGTFTINFTNCDPTEQPDWFAFQDNAGPWTVVAGVNHAYTFTVASSRGGIAFHHSGGGVNVQYGTTAELTAQGTDFCSATITGKTVNGTVAGVTATDQAFITLGNGRTFLSSVPTFQLNHVEDGALDMVAFRRAETGTTLPSAVIRRGQNIAAGGSLGHLNFDSTEAFVPDSALMTLSGLLGGETVNTAMSYAVGASCTDGALYSGIESGATFMALGIPGAHQVASDYHNLQVAASVTDADDRFLIMSFHTLSARTATLGALMPAPTVTTLAGPYKRLQAVYTLPADYNSTSYRYDDGSSASIDIDASLAYLGSTAVTLAAPDFSALAGWSNSWMPGTSATGTWRLTGTATTPNFTLCTEGGSVKSAGKPGTF